MQSMSSNKSDILGKNLIFGAVAITLIMTPNLNKDSLVIPKVILLFCLALLLTPFIIKSLKNHMKNPYIQRLLIIESILFIFGILVLLNSASPLDQLIYGRTGRGLGFVTFVSTLLLTVASALLINLHNQKTLLLGLVWAGLVTSIYSCLQFFGIDIFKWESATNGIIGTLGNPNSQSSFAATVLIPALIVFWTSKYRTFIIPCILLLILFTIYISQSTQGYIGLISSTIALALIFTWYRRKKLFLLLSISTFIAGVVALFGMLGHGPLSIYLYKVSVQSRGDFWRSAFTTGNSHPLFGVGFDSFGDYSLKYRDELAASHSFAEYTDSAHNFYLDYLATGGYFFLLIYMLLLLFTLRAFFVLNRSHNSYNRYISAFFCAWLVIQLQTMINTQTITFLTWNAILSGAIIGMAGTSLNDQSIDQSNPHLSKQLKHTYIQGITLVVIGLIVVFPYFNNDRLFAKASNTGNGDLLIKSTTAFPQSVTRYSLASRALLDSGLPEPSLYLAKKAVEFNPKSVGLWALILVNQSATLEERQNAKNRILQLDPLNKEIKDLLVQ